MNKVSLNELIYNKILRSSFVMVVVIIFIFLIVFYGTNSYITGEMLGVLRQNVVQEIKYSVEREVDLLESNVEEIAETMKVVQSNHEQFYSYIDSVPEPKTFARFGVHENGAYYKLNDNGGSALYYSADTVMDEKAIRQALYTEYLDETFKHIVEGNQWITQMYINTTDNMNRIYPFIDEIPLQYGSTINMRDYNFYYLADLKHNPQKQPVWTSAYLDPAGQGWMVSCVVPVYDDDYLVGVTGVDITLSVMVDEVLDLKLPVESAIFITDQDGVIMAMSEEVESIFGLEELKEHEYVDIIDGTIHKPEIFKLDHQQNQYIGERFIEMLNYEVDETIIDIQYQPYHVIKNQVKGTGWHLFVLTDQDELLSPVYNVEDQVTIISVLVFILVLVLFGIFYIFFIRRAGQLASDITSPIMIIADLTKDLGKTSDLGQLPEGTGILELDALTDQYRKMVFDLDARTKELVEQELESKIQEQLAENYKKQAMIDELTQVYNRRKIDEVLDQEVNRSVRYNQSLSVILVDIDHFKNVNDKYGHDVGDEVLKDFAKLLKEYSRTTDQIARWGGEEFLIVCPHTEIKGAMILAEKLRKVVEEFKFTTDEHQTASFGVVEYIHGNNKRQLLKRVDSAMYDAKSQSRNCVVAGK